METKRTTWSAVIAALMVAATLFVCMTACKTVEDDPATYAVTYDANGATSGSVPAAQTKTEGTDLTLAANSGSLVKTGYTFAGWNTKADGTGDDYAAGASYTTDAAITLYAQWSTTTNTVTYDANGATSGTAPAAQTKTQGTDLTLAANSGSLVKTGYTFAGWNTQADGSGDNYAVGASYTADEAITLYAKWTQLSTYIVTYDANGATSGSVPAAQTKIKGTDLTLAANSGSLAKTGYTFAGWDTKADGKGTTYEAGASYTADAAITLYAQWTINTYTVTYDANDATSGTTPEAQTKTHGIALVLAANSGSLAKTNYTFAGWNTQADGKGTDHAEGASYTADANVPLYAKWTAVEYGITYTLNGGSWETGYTAPATYTVEQNVTLPVAANLTKAGYTFGGWYDNASCTGSAVTAIVTGTTGDKALYAKWTINTYTVTYDANGATSGTAPEAQTKTHGTDLTLSANSGSLAKTAYTSFAGWNTKADGSGDDYAVGASYTADAAITLYAKWLINVSKYMEMTEKVIITSDTEITGSNSSCSTYYNGEFTFYKGVFIQDYNITLSPFIMSKYEVTQELYQTIMGTNPSYFQGIETDKVVASGETQLLRPVDTVTWYDAVAFCNELTKKTMTESDCVYTITGITKTGDTITAATVTADHTKKGYRLPTEAEWEFAARGGDSAGETWGYAYAGVQGENIPKDFRSYPYHDTQLDTCGWNDNNSDNRTHEVGLKSYNALDLYDMSGNVNEWCYDWYVGSSSLTGTVNNPLGPTTGSNRLARGGNWYTLASSCLVSQRSDADPSEATKKIGFRVCRTK